MKLFQKTLCLICEKKCGKVYTTVKYRYEDGKLGEVYICEECSKDYDVEDMNLNDETL
jgi:hypothetical protein